MSEKHKKRVENRKKLHDKLARRKPNVDTNIRELTKIGLVSVEGGLNVKAFCNYALRMGHPEEAIKKVLKHFMIRNPERYIDGVRTEPKEMG